MDSVNSASDIQSRPPAPIGGLMGGAFDTNGPSHGLFADALAQTKAAAPPAQDPVNKPPTAPSNTQPSSQASQNNNNGANSSDKSGASNSSSQPSSAQASSTQASSPQASSAQAPLASSSPPGIGKLSKHHAKEDTSDDKSGTKVEGKEDASSAPASAPVTAPAPTDISAPAITATPATLLAAADTAAPVVTSAPADNSSTTAIRDIPVPGTVAATNSPPNSAPVPLPNPTKGGAAINPVSGTDPAADLAPTADATPTVAAATTPTPTLAPAPTPAPAAPVVTPPVDTDPTVNASNAALVPNAPASNSDPTANTATPSDANNTTASGDTKTPTTNNAPASQLLSLLTQLEHLAVSQLTNAQPTANTGPSATGNKAQDATTDSTQSATSTKGSDTQDKIDLKALLTAIAKLDGNDPTTNAADTGTGDSQNAPALAANTTSLLQKTASATNAAPLATDNGKLISADFLDLFSVPTNTPVGSNAFLIPGLAVETTANSDAALDADTQNENGTSARSGTSDLLSNNLLPQVPPSTQSVNPYDFASQLSATRATQGGTTGLPTPVEQVVLQLSRGFSDDDPTQMNIQLRPAELGRVDVKLTIGNDGKVQGTVTADNPTTLGLLLKDVRGLERALQEAGLRADSGSLQFSLRGDGQPGGGSGQLANGNSSGFANHGTSSNSAIPVPDFANATETYYLTPGGVNMRV